MADVLRFFVQYEAVLYFLLGLGGILYFYRFWLAWQELREATYGLERQASRERLNQAAIMLFGLLVIAVGVFAMVTFVATSLPAQALLATPTLSFSMDLQTGATTVTPAGDEVLATATALPTVAVDPAACIPAQIAITEPEPGSVLSGSVTVNGTVDVTDFGFYKFEVARAEEELWLTIQAGRSIVREGALVENWDTSRLPNGEYVLQLVVTDSSGRELPPCRVPVRIEAPSS
ncbi:MAG: hypothetical protein KF828_03605 [Anaerolineales bacterium]|nr:hypothetical protein [Anaerolineales bacterium]